MEAQGVSRQQLAHKFWRKWFTIAILVLFAWSFALLWADFRSFYVEDPKLQTPVLVVTDGRAIVVNKKLTIGAGERTSLEIGDRVRTLPVSKATIFWPGGSVTRLGENTSIVISKMQISANNNFQIEFAIERGKTWSNVVKYLIGDSYFKEEVKESSLIAAVRGTIFEVNLDKGYIHTVDHAIEIQNTHDRSSFSLPEGTAVNMLQNLEKISLEMLDKAWIDFNNREDVMYTKELSRQFYEKLSSADIGARFWDYLMTRFFGKNVFMDNLENRILELESLAPVDDQKASVFSRAIDVYELLYFMPLSDRVLDFKTRLRRIILTTAPEESRRGFEDDFSRHLLYEYWESLRAGMVMQILSIQSSLAELSKMGVNLEKLKAIDNWFSQEMKWLFQQATENLGAKGVRIVDIFNSGSFVDFNILSQDSIREAGRKFWSQQRGFFKFVIDFFRSWKDQ